MPFGYYQSNSEIALASAIRIMKESGANTVKLEGGEEVLESVKKIVSAGVPVMGHLGLTPQSINKFGTYVVRATEEAEADKLRKDALLLQEAGCFAIVLEKIPATLAKEVSESLHILVTTPLFSKSTLIFTLWSCLLANTHKEVTLAQFPKSAPLPFTIFHNSSLISAANTKYHV